MRWMRGPASEFGGWRERKRKRASEKVREGGREREREREGRGERERENKRARVRAVLFPRGNISYFQKLLASVANTRRSR